MLNENLLEAIMIDSPKGPPRQYLRITDAGLAQLKARQHEWNELRESVSRCLELGSKA